MVGGFWDMKPEKENLKALGKMEIPAIHLRANQAMPISNFYGLIDVHYLMQVALTHVVKAEPDLFIFKIAYSCNSLQVYLSFKQRSTGYVFSLYR